MRSGLDKGESSQGGSPFFIVSFILLFKKKDMDKIMKPGHMLDKLQESFKLLPHLLENREAWDSLIVNRRKPYTYRVFTTLPNGLRLCLHKFDPCHTHEAFSHPHPWPGAFMILEGSYKMNVGYSCLGRKDKNPVNVISLIMTKNSSYEIIDPLTWHSVIPLETTYTVMVNDVPWDTATVAHADVRTTKGKDLDKLSEDELTSHLFSFKKLVEYHPWQMESRISKARASFAEEIRKTGR